jgi:hypothetical protein
MGGRCGDGGRAGSRPGTGHSVRGAGTAHSTHSPGGSSCRCRGLEQRWLLSPDGNTQARRSECREPRGTCRFDVGLSAGNLCGHGVELAVHVSAGGRGSYRVKGFFHPVSTRSPHLLRIACICLPLPWGTAPSRTGGSHVDCAADGQQTVRVLDLVLLTKDAGASELRDGDGSEAGQLRAAEADLAVLLAGSDVEEIGSGVEPGSVADAAAGAARAADPGEVRRVGEQAAIVALAAGGGARTEVAVSADGRERASGPFLAGG